MSELKQLLLNRHDPLRTVGTVAGKHRIDIGVHLKERLDHLAHSSSTRVLRQDLATLLKLFHLIAHYHHNWTLAKPEDAKILSG